jgi:hypothetical protein
MSIVLFPSSPNAAGDFFLTHGKKKKASPSEKKNLSETLAHSETVKDRVE